MAKILNMTPRDVTIVAEDGTVLHKIPSDGVARASQFLNQVGTVNGIALVEMVYSEPVDLPDPQDGIYIIVSHITAHAAKAAGRTTEDLLLLDLPVRDEALKILGFRGFRTLEQS